MATGWPCSVMPSSGLSSPAENPAGFAQRLSKWMLQASFSHDLPASR